MKYVVIDVSGNVVRSGWCQEPDLQAGSGETAMAVEDHDGRLIEDSRVKVDLTEGEGFGLFIPIDPEDEAPVPGGRAVALETPA